MIEIRRDDLSDGKLIKLLELHRQQMFEHSPAESVHALDVGAMTHPDVRFFSAIKNGHFVACGALKHHHDKLVEIKSMKTIDQFLRQGIAKAMLSYLIDEARSRGYKSVCLETGTMNAFIAARNLYASAGFISCEPFADYFADPHSVCMMLELVE